MKTICFLFLLPFFAFATLPCLEAGCQEICTYATQGGGDSMKLTTIFTKDEGDQFKTRALLSFSVSRLFVTANLYFDETDTWLSQQVSNPQLQQVGVSLRTYVKNKLKKVSWERHNFHWSKENQVNNYTEVSKIQAKDEDQLRQNHPNFVPYLPITSFYEDWLGAYDEGGPLDRPDFSMKGFSPTISSPIMMSFFLVRFLDPTKDYNFEVFNAAPQGQNVATMTIKPQDQRSTTFWRAPITLGELKSPDEQPFVMTVDKKTKKLKEIEIHLEHDLGQLSFKARLQECKIRSSIDP